MNVEKIYEMATTIGRLTYFAEASSELLQRATFDNSHDKERATVIIEKMISEIENYNLTKAEKAL